MQTPPRIDFHGMEPDEEKRERIRRQIERLEGLFGGMTACRVVVTAPGARPRSGGLYDINVHAVLPDDREVAVERTPHQDERFADFDFALNDAFSRARRQLQDQVRQMRGETKRHESGLTTGVVKTLRRSEGYGFLEAPDGREIYFHRNSVQDGSFDDLSPGVRVHFVEEPGREGPQASRLRPVGRDLT
jgi:cold shock CspA family protein